MRQQGAVVEWHDSRGQGLVVAPPPDSASSCTHDEQPAAQGSWRTHESTLQLLALPRGRPGAWIAQKHLRHKSRKGSFRLTFGVMVVINLAGLLWLCRQSSPGGGLPPAW
ncbi:DUF1294 domain-containing protein [Rhodanobacter ginsengiterrae]|uniref:DUF1294 domain-containing protein n=1 Tax=Rhodanobacter ginsengiterrae TaxID=2008451 RepID=UPI003CF0EEBB